MSAANDRIRRELGFPLIEAEREARKERSVRWSEVGNHFPDAGEMVDQSALSLRDGVVLQARK